MNEQLKKEIGELIEELGLDCPVEEFKELVNWSNISLYQTLSENFIREFKELVDWNGVSYNQILSPEFIYEFQNKLYMEYLLGENKITTEQLELIKLEENEYRYDKLVGNKSKRWELLDIK